MGGGWSAGGGGDSRQHLIASSCKMFDSYFQNQVSLRGWGYTSYLLTVIGKCGGGGWGLSAVKYHCISHKDHVRLLIKSCHIVSMSKYWLTYFVYQNLHGTTTVFYFYLRKGIWLDDSGPKNLNFFFPSKTGYCDMASWHFNLRTGA